MKIYCDRFMATETLQNGSERRCIRKVYSLPFQDGIHYGLEQRIADGIAALKERHLYRIEYVDTQQKDIIAIGKGLAL